MRGTLKPTHWCPFAKDPELTSLCFPSTFNIAALTGAQESFCGCDNKNSHINMVRERMKMDFVCQLSKMA